MSLVQTEVLPDVIHIVEPHAELIYGGVEVGNVDTRPHFGDTETSFQARKDFVSVLRPAHYVLQIVGLEAKFLDLSDIADQDLASAYRTDGLFIDRPGIALGLNPADCNAITMYDGRAGKALGLIHAGRQGVDGDIHLASLEHLIGNFGVAKEDVRLHFAPSIREGSYHYPTIPAEQLADPKWRGFIDLRRGNFHIDLVGRIITEYIDAGIQPEQMQVSPIDVGSDPSYFSHVRSKKTGETPGRNGVAAMLRK